MKKKEKKTITEKNEKNGLLEKPHTEHIKKEKKEKNQCKYF